MVVSKIEDEGEVRITNKQINAPFVAVTNKNRVVFRNNSIIEEEKHGETSMNSDILIFQEDANKTLSGISRSVRPYMSRNSKTDTDRNYMCHVDTTMDGRVHTEGQTAYNMTKL